MTEDLLADQLSPWDPEDVTVFLTAEGQLSNEDAAEGIDLRALYKRMLAARCLDLRLGKAQLPMWVSSAGEEAPIIASALLTSDDDWIYPGLRDLAVAPMRGMDLDEFVLQMLADRSKVFAPELGIAPISASLGMHLALAAGRAHGQKILHLQNASPAITLALFGEGVTTVGLFHETVALAVTCDLPLVLICKSQLWPNGAPLEAGLFGEPVAERARVCGLWTRKRDGADILGVYRALEQAITRAREGLGPSLIEVVVTPLNYVDAPSERDPIERLRRCLEQRNEWSPDFQQAIETEIYGQLDRSFVFAEQQQNLSQTKSAS